MDFKAWTVIIKRNMYKIRNYEDRTDGQLDNVENVPTQCGEWPRIKNLILLLFI